MDYLHNLFYFIVVVGILVAFHEFGHFWVARQVGVKVLRFSIGFGKVLWSKQKNNQSTEYVLSAIPLGGYVKMVDEREGPVTSEDLPFSFNRQPLWARTAIVTAGPLFNLILAVALFWSVLVIGESGFKPILGKVEQGTLAAAAGFVEGDEIISVNDQPTPTWTQTLTTLIGAALEGEQEINVAVKNHDDLQTVKVLKFSEQDAENPEALYQRLGFNAWSPQLNPIIGQVLPDSAAQSAGLKQGDLLVSADNVVIQGWQQWVDYVKTHPNMPINLLIERDGVRLPLSITPKAVQVEQKTEGKIGASVQVPEDLIESMTVEYILSPMEAVPVAFETTYEYSIATLKMMGKILVGRASVKNLSGPISIADYAGKSASMGLVPFLKFMALVSVSLGVLNLLPIPVLDGGHLLFFAIEGIKGSPVSEKMQLIFQQIGIALLVSLMTLVMFLEGQKYL
ncbi:MAG: RIP metalloprotease RseP [Methylococcaceae bacterium]|nr:RIP metalloprotease RseP [Methylococcaceae bacterium]MDZ4156142.1 RIP metalloprotease RseP [Methylococcales bacterium]MDP2393720.1 RIP metalloprotease RseP [Methylococcaceae bacterium]MDP3019746.1 RIP metalloprotease RseP [Methylococcaceae bacterium]MDP3390215.1 RIP metalloprotease RseP [Methylococcaceae bacterium]